MPIGHPGVLFSGVRFHYPTHQGSSLRAHVALRVRMHQYDLDIERIKMSDLAHQLGFKNIKDLYYDFRNNCRKGGYGFVPAEAAPVIRAQFKDQGEQSILVWTYPNLPAQDGQDSIFNLEQKRLGPAGLDDVNYLINSGKDYEMILQKIIK